MEASQAEREEEDEKEVFFFVDVGNLLVSDSRDTAISASSSREDISRKCLERGTKALQALAERLFKLPSTPEKIGRLVKLPSPLIQLPREKPLPKPRPPTKWEIFAQRKGLKFSGSIPLVLCY